MSDETLMIRGVRIPVDPKVMSAHMVGVLRAGLYEADEARAIPRIVNRGDRIVEIGGGIGFISSLAHKLGKAEAIAVYEANPALIPVIRRTHKLNGVTAEVNNAVILPAARRTTMPFYVREHFWASSLSPSPEAYRTSIDVPVVTFAAMLKRHAPTILIVDIEGGEAQLFRNVPLTGVKKVYIELHPKIIGQAGMQRLFEFFSQRSFQVVRQHSRGKVFLFKHAPRRTRVRPKTR